MSNPGDVQADGLPVAVTDESVAFTTLAALGLDGAQFASRYAGGTDTGSPGSGTFAAGDFVIDQTGAIWVCTVAGSAGTWVQAGSSLVDVLALNGGSDTAGSAPVLTPAFASGVAAQLSDTSRDYVVYLQFGIAGTGLTLAIGPTSTPANTIIDSAAVVAGEMINFRLPAGWYAEVTFSTTSLAHQAAVGC